MLGRIDDAWPLAEARSEHLSEVSCVFPGAEYLGLIALIDGDRERACRHTAEHIDKAPPGSDGRHGLVEVDASRDLYYLGRIEEVEPLLDAARMSGRHPVERTLLPAVEALLLSSAGAHDQAAERRVPPWPPRGRDRQRWLQAGATDLALVLERAGCVSEARGALKRALTVWERKRCLPYAERARAQIDSLRRLWV